MKNLLLIIAFSLVMPVLGYSQTEVHNTMFMFNKLIYNPAYAGTRDLTSVDALYRNQWTAIKGAPKMYNISIDGLLGSYEKDFRSVGLGLSINSETLGVETKQNVVANYAYRLKLKNESILSLGISGGAQFYSANYNELDPYQLNDPSISKDVKNAELPNFGFGAFWSAENYYAGLSVPNLLENYYDQAGKRLGISTARQIRSFYFNGGYLFNAGENTDIMTQFMSRYAADGKYSLPLNVDINASFIFNKRFLAGITIRTDKSFEAILQVQAAKNINIGYSYDYLVSALNGYNSGAHEIMVGFNFIRDQSRFPVPQFVKPY